jgi:acetyl-CoA carboxylase biotin carboxyl carrier protein
MAWAALVAKVERHADGLLVRSPAVGVVQRLPEPGQVVGFICGEAVLTRGGVRHVLRLPVETRGIVAERLVPAGAVAVEYGQPLLRLSETLIGSAGAVAPGLAAPAEVAGEPGLVAVRAHSEGIFYRRPAPDRAPYVDAGSVVEPGHMLGLVEVMKSFNPVVYGGPELPARATVVKALVEDGTEISFGQVLFLVKAG